MSNTKHTVTATDNTIDLDTLSRVTGGVAPQPGCRDGGCIPQPFPRPNPFPGPRNPFPGPRNPFPGPRNPFDNILGGPIARAGAAAGGE